MAPPAISPARRNRTLGYAAERALRPCCSHIRSDLKAHPDLSVQAANAKIGAMTPFLRTILKPAKAARLASLVLLGATLSAALPSNGEPGALPLSQTKAANLARMRAETLNGGVSGYRADRCMYSTGAPECLVRQTPDGYIFSFRGGPPGWQQRNPVTPTVTTTVTVSADGQTIRSVTNTPIP